MSYMLLCHTNCFQENNVNLYIRSYGIMNVLPNAMRLGRLFSNIPNVNVNEYIKI